MSIPECRLDESDVAEFQLPLLGLYGDLETGRGSVSLPEDFEQCPPEVQLGLLRDWQRGLLTYREAALSRLAQQVSATSPGLSRHEVLMRMRAICDSLDIEAPTEIAALPRRG